VATSAGQHTPHHELAAPALDGVGGSVAALDGVGGGCATEGGAGTGGEDVDMGVAARGAGVVRGGDEEEEGEGEDALRGLPGPRASLGLEAGDDVSAGGGGGDGDVGM
jgi:hypothetical protein